MTPTLGAFGCSNGVLGKCGYVGPPSGQYGGIEIYVGNIEADAIHFDVQNYPVLTNLAIQTVIAHEVGHGCSMDDWPYEQDPYRCGAASCRFPSWLPQLAAILRGGTRIPRPATLPRT